MTRIPVIPRVGASLIIALILLGLGRVNRTEATAGANGQPAQSNAMACGRPASYEMKVMCGYLEAQILAVTVRIEMQGWSMIGGQRLPLKNGGKSHATIVGGRYLVTHNHFSYALTEEAGPEDAGYTGISLRTADGRMLIDHAPLSIFTIAYQESETLVLDFVNPDGEGLFDSLGLPSAEMRDWRAIQWEPDTEVAQIDWDGVKAHVDWVKVELVNSEGNTAYIEVSNYTTKGASGGGVFWQGTHIANVWARNMEKDSQNGQINRFYTLLALNPPALAGMGSGSNMWP